jgi:uncharacterized protein YdiU (UPF0061 family)
MPAQSPSLGSAFRFDNSFVRSLPADPIQGPRVRQVRGACFSFVSPTPVSGPRLVAFAPEVAELLDLPRAVCESDEFAQVFSGTRVLEGMQPYAACYGGHQFGNWAGQLGDGRAISLGEVINTRGERWELQLKGAGRTPYSRTADGRAVLRSSLREFLCSEAMHHLGIPTTRALSLVTTGESVLRDILYNGDARHEPGAVVCRVAPSFLRFGNYEILAAREEHALLRTLIDYTLTTHYPELGPPGPDSYVRWFEEICQRTATLMVHWMRVGFVHGVMNTDNMSILGLTIDYGPYGFLEPYEPSWTPNITDAAGRRYRYENQPQVAQWNLLRLANALYSVVGAAEPLERALAGYAATFERDYSQMLAAKLGLTRFHNEPHLHHEGVIPADEALVDELFGVLGMVETDMTLFYRRLALVSAEQGAESLADQALLEPIQAAYYAPEALPDAARAAMCGWLRRYVARVQAEGTSDLVRRARMSAVNPKYVLRNYLAQQAIERAESGDPALVLELLDVLRRPYDEQPEKEVFAAKRPEWARNRAGCSMLSCSS